MHGCTWRALSSPREVLSGLKQEASDPASSLEPTTWESTFDERPRIPMGRCWLHGRFWRRLSLSLRGIRGQMRGCGIIGWWQSPRLEIVSLFEGMRGETDQFHVATHWYILRLLPSQDRIWPWISCPHCKLLPVERLSLISIDECYIGVRFHVLDRFEWHTLQLLFPMSDFLLRCQKRLEAASMRGSNPGKS